MVNLEITIKVVIKIINKKGLLCPKIIIQVIGSQLSKSNLVTIHFKSNYKKNLDDESTFISNCLFH